MASAPKGRKTSVIAIPVHSPTCYEAVVVREAGRGFSEEVGVEIGEVETVLGEVHETLGLVPYNVHRFSYTKTKKTSIISVYLN